jgi:hypothetical protein
MGAKAKKRLTGNKKSRTGKSQKKSKQSNSPIRSQLGTHWLDCDECGIEGADVDKDVTRFVCWRCTAAKINAPEFSEETQEEKARRQVRNWKKAIAASLEKQNLEVPKEFQIKTRKKRKAKKVGAARPKGYTRGWHRRKVFVSDDKRFFTYGKEITEKQYGEITEKQYGKLLKEQKAQPPKKSAKKCACGCGERTKGGTFKRGHSKRVGR